MLEFIEFSFWVQFHCIGRYRIREAGEGFARRGLCFDISPLSGRLPHKPSILRTLTLQPFQYILSKCFCFDWSILFFFVF